MPVAMVQHDPRQPHQTTNNLAACFVPRPERCFLGHDAPFGVEHTPALACLNDADVVVDRRVLSNDTLIEAVGRHVCQKVFLGDGDQIAKADVVNVDAIGKGPHSPPEHIGAENRNDLLVVWSLRDLHSACSSTGADCPLSALDARHLAALARDTYRWPMSTGGEARDDEIRAIVLDALIAGRTADDVADVLRSLHVEGSTYPASVLMELAADAYLACGSSRTDRLEVDGLAERMLPEDPARGNVGHSKRRHCVQGAIMIAAGAEPEDTGWWSTDDLWRHALDAAVVFVRAAAERQGAPVEDVCGSLATT